MEAVKLFDYKVALKYMSNRCGGNWPRPDSGRGGVSVTWPRDMASESSDPPEPDRELPRRAVES